MSGLVLFLILMSAALHPLREFFIKGDSSPEGVTLAVNIWFWVLAGAHVFIADMDPWTAFEVWPMMVISGLGLLVFYSCIVATMRSGDLSIYYPITRSSPLFVVVFSYLHYEVLVPESLPSDVNIREGTTDTTGLQTIDISTSRTGRSYWSWNYWRTWRFWRTVLWTVLRTVL